MDRNPTAIWPTYTLGRKNSPKHIWPNEHLAERTLHKTDIWKNVKICKYMNLIRFKPNFTQPNLTLIQTKPNPT